MSTQKCKEPMEQPVQKKARIDDDPNLETNVAKLVTKLTDEMVKVWKDSAKCVGNGNFIPGIAATSSSQSLPGIELRSFQVPETANPKKFISGLGFDIYSIFYQKLLRQTTRVRKPEGNRWENFDDLNAMFSDEHLRDDDYIPLNPYWELGIFADQPFPIAGECCRVDNFPGTICYYYEVKVTLLERTGQFRIGLSCDKANIPTDHPLMPMVGNYPNSYAIRRHWGGWILAGEMYRMPNETIPIQPNLGSMFRLIHTDDIVGCGLRLDPDNKLAIFFTINGILLGQQPISPSVDHLWPTVSLANVSLEANFGDDTAKPFKYDIHKFHGME